MALRTYEKKMSFEEKCKETQAWRILIIDASKEDGYAKSIVKTTHSIKGSFRSSDYTISFYCSKESSWTSS